MDFENKTYTLTFGDRAENHRGMQIIGTQARDGFTYQDLRDIKINFENAGATCKLIKLNRYLPESIDVDKAYILIIRNGVDYVSDKVSADKLYVEQENLEYDKKAFMYGRVVNKNARYNLCFSEKSQKADYEIGKGTIVAFHNVKTLNRMRKTLSDFFGVKAKDLQIEANFYYDIDKCGIGYHGDSERKIVIGIRLGGFYVFALSMVS